MPVQKFFTPRTLATTLALSAIVIATPAIANENDTFTAITKGETVLDVVFNTDDHCEFIIKDKASKQSGLNHMREKITKLSGEKPVMRGKTHAWTLENATPNIGQARTVSILITEAKDGTHRLHMDRRKGERGNNARSKRSRKTAPSVTPPAPKPRLLPPPANID